MGLAGAFVTGAGFVCVLMPGFLGLECGNRAWVAVISPALRFGALKTFAVAALAAAVSILVVAVLPLPSTEPPLTGVAGIGYTIGLVAGFLGRLLGRPK
jgi:hypothetical protein